MRQISDTPQRRRLSAQECAERRPLNNRMAILLILTAFVTWGCRPRPEARAKKTAIGWRPVASWSGHGNYQTESFYMENGQWRVRWKTSERQVSKAGAFRAIIHSTVSGRFVEVAAEHQGAGSGMTYVAEDPRQFFLVIESSGVDWNIAVEEGVVGEE
jgi:hypothetical protein